MEQSNLPLDFVDLLSAFDRAEVRYLIIGGHAVGYHDRPRTTKDLDLIQSKRASGREQDLIDARNLETSGSQRP